MNFLSEERSFKANMGTISFADVLERLERENFYEEGYFELEEKINKDWILFSAPGDRVTSSQVYEFKYDRDRKEIVIKGRYKSIFFPALLSLYALPIIFFLLDRDLSKLKTIMPVVVLFSIFILIAGYFRLRTNSKAIERDVVIRINAILKERGMTNSI